MKKLYKYILLTGVLFTTFSCNNDELDSVSIFDTTSPDRNEFDKWILDSLTKPYNITIDYLYKDNETDIAENVVPAKIEQSMALAKLMKHVWMDAYTEVAGKEFLKNNCFRHFCFVGSGEYTSQGTVKLGQAEGGIKVTLFRVNEFDIDNIYINTDDFYRSHGTSPIDMNFWYFHTMHHEFCHILTQLKEYSPEFQMVSTGKYSGPDWNNVSDEDAAARGFVTGYSTKEFNEDFAETYAVYVTSSDKIWEQILDKATKYLTDDNGDPVYEVDKKGNKVTKKDANGKPVFATDNYGFLIPETDVNGNIIYDTDKNGDPIYFLDEDSLMIPMYQEQVYDANGKYTEPYYYYNEETDSIEAYFYYGKLYPIYVTSSSFTPIVETINGDTIYDKNGKMIPKYYRQPVFQYEYVQKVDETAKNTILQKLEYVRAYLKEQWNLDIDELRKKIQEKSSATSLKSLNLRSLKD